ncbi:MAG TPA: glycosyltransferase [Acidimicrobiales bacterium]|nr:glycosyltransferase [Acidimicrobiales bacterium]
MQSAAHRERGIARYVLELAQALDRLAPERVAGFLLNPDLTTPGSVEPLLATGKVAFADRADAQAASVLHVMSPVELDVPLGRLWPEGGGWRRLRLVVTVYDLIPELFPDRYLADPGLRRRYRARLALVRAADRVLAISRCTADDVAGHLDIAPGRVTVIGGGTAAHFAPPASRPAAAAAAAAMVPGLAPPYVLYTGGIEDRKNIDRLLVAWSRLAPPVRDGWQLVVACRVGAPQRADLERRAGELGIGARLLLTGYVSEPTLVALYQGTDLFVFPSLYEGFGLPVAEAMACGAPAVAARTSSLPELVGNEALFDPLDPDAVAGAITRGLTDRDHRRALVEAASRPPPSWDAVARATLGAYDEVLDRRPPRRRAGARARVALASPLPPERSGVARFSHRLVAGLTAHCDVDVFVDGGGEAQPPPGVEVFAVDRLERVAAARGGYDRVVYCLGNSEFHAGALAALRRRPGLVLAHDVRLTDLYALSARRPDAVPGGFHAALQRLYGGRVPVELGAGGRLTAAEASHHGVVMAREVVALSQRFLTFSDFAARLAALDADPAHAGRIGRLPFAVEGAGPVRSGWAIPGDGPVVATFGVVNEVKRPTTVVEAFALVAAAWPAARLAVVGPASEHDAGRVRAVAAGLGVGDRVVVTGEVDDDEYGAWLGRATVAVQLREVSNGESSAAVGNCLASGVPTVVSDLGAARSLPDGGVVKVPAAVPAGRLAGEVLALLADEGRRRRLGTAALAYAGEHTFARLAADLAAAALS